MANPQSLPAQSGNRLLARLPQAEYQRLSSHLQTVPLVLKHVLYKPQAKIDYVYFPINGIISAMTIMQDGSAIEVATIGNEGMAGVMTFLGSGTSSNEVMVQVPGDSLRMAADTFKAEADRKGPLREVITLYSTAFYAQVSYAVACNGLHTVEKRCCRWLLMTMDRVGSAVLPLTHEFLAIMLGVRRPSVTEVLQPLQARGLIRNRRGKIEILDRAGVESIACECYQSIKNEFVRLFG